MASTHPNLAARPDAGRVLLYATVVLLWVVAAWNRSLWGDEFHSLHHARAADLAEFFRVVRTDNHPPLAFLMMRISRALFGEGHFALRLPGLLYLLPYTWLVVRLAQRLPDARARQLAPWLVVLSSYRLMVFGDARMYGLLALAVLGLVAASLDALERPVDSVGPGRRPALAAAALWVAVGLHTHYYFFHYLGVLGLTVLVLALRRRELRPAALRLLGAGLAGGLAFLPWALWGFREQLGHGLPAGTNYNHLGTWLQSLAHLFFINASLGGAWVTRYVALPGALAAGVLVALGMLRMARAPAQGRPRIAFALLAATALAAPAWAGLAAGIIPRASYNWPYIAGSCAPLLLLAGAGLASPPRRLTHALGSVLVAAMTAVTLVNAFTPGQEDYRGAVRHILQRARPSDAIVTRAVWDQDPDARATGWRYYLERSPPELAARAPTEYGLPDYAPALTHERVWIFIRRRWSDAGIRDLRATFPKEEITPIGAVMSVRLYSR